MAHKQKISRFTGFGILSLHATGILLGVSGIIILTSRETDKDILMGTAFLFLALVIQATTCKSLSAGYAGYYYSLGTIMAAAAAFAFFLYSPISLECRVLLSAACLGFAVCLRFKIGIAEMSWHLICAACCVAALAFLLFLIVVTSPGQWILASIYLGLSLFFALRYGGAGRDEAQRHKGCDFGVEELWKRGRIWDIFELPADAAASDITQKFACKRAEHYGRIKSEKILLDAFAVLKVKEDKELFKKARRVMDYVRKTRGDKRFERKEAFLWEKLWTEMNEKYSLRPELVTEQVLKDLCEKYARLI